MRHHIFKEADSYPIALLIKTSYFRPHELQTNYLDRLAPAVVPEQVIAFDLDYGGRKTVTASIARKYLVNELLPVLQGLGTRLLYVADAAYFKVLTGVTKTDPNLGYVIPCKLKGFEQFKVILGLNYGQLVYNPELYQKLDLTLDTLAATVQGTYLPPGENVIQSAHYPETTQQIAAALENLHQYPSLAVDIETFDLHPYKAGIGTVGFAWNQHEGIAFACDYRPLARPQGPLHGEQVANKAVRYLLRKFFENYQGSTRWHNGGFDIRTKVATLWMEHPQDFKGMLAGLDIMFRNMEDTRLIAYLALNSTAGNHLSLKELAHTHAGNYAQDEITDIRKIPLPDLLEYNLVDALCTNYVFDTYYPQMVKDQQETLYQELLKPSLKVVTQMELVGMPMDPQQVLEAEAVLDGIAQKNLRVLRDSRIIQNFEKALTYAEWEKDFADRKAEAKNPDKILPKDKATYPHKQFNPNSGPQLQQLLYEVIGLPVLDYTKTRQPAVGGKTLAKLVNHTSDEEVLNILEALQGWIGVDKIRTSFIPNFKAAIDKGDGVRWLHGSFLLGGTVSGRMSSSNPNLQQLPSGSTYGKLMKQCFVAPKGWIFCGADFASLEDRINALLTKDPAKIKVYVDGFDGHALRTYHYWPQEFPNLKETPEDINTIKKHPLTGEEHPLRGKSKGPTFALTFQGTWQTLVKNAGFSEEEAKRIEANYHKLYAESTRWVKARIDEASKQGYSEGAFGLRIRAPLLAQSMLGHRTTPRESDAEARTLGNAISGQSYGLLNNRASNELMEKVWASEFRHDILPVALIHDAQYFLVRDNVHAVKFLNDHLIEAMRWQELPEIQHPEVRLGAELDLFWPDWSHSITLPNDATPDEIRTLVAEYLNQHQAHEA